MRLPFLVVLLGCLSLASAQIPPHLLQLLLGQQMAGLGGEGDSENSSEEDSSLEDDETEFLADTGERMNYTKYTVEEPEKHVEGFIKNLIMSKASMIYDFLKKRIKVLKTLPARSDKEDSNAFKKRKAFVSDTIDKYTDVLTGGLFSMPIDYKKDVKWCVISVELMIQGLKDAYKQMKKESDSERKQTILSSFVTSKNILQDKNVCPVKQKKVEKKKKKKNEMPDKMMRMFAKMRG